MSVATLNGHVLLPHRASYTAPVRWQRSWTNTVASSVLGSEKRAAQRTWPRQQVTWSFEPVTLEESNALLERLKAARKSGYAAAPMFGYGMALADEADSDTVTVTAMPAQVYPDDYLIFLSGSGDTWDVVTVASVRGKTLMLSDELQREYAAGEMFWLLLFGKFECGELPLIVDADYRVECSLQELAARAFLIRRGDDRCCNNMAIEGASDTFECYPPENPLVSTLASGGGWAGPWVFLFFPGLCCWEPWDSYPDTEEPSGLNGGIGLLASWVFNNFPPPVYIIETWETYDTAEDPMHEGEGWSGEWQLIPLEEEE